MKRIQKVIAKVTIAEKEERAKEKIIQTNILGFDPEVWMGSSLKIRSENFEQTTYHSLNLPPPKQGRRKYHSCKQAYLDIHAFLAYRRWTGIDDQSEVGGVSWVELFILFDVGKYRSCNGDHIKNQAAGRRADPVAAAGAAHGGHGRQRRHVGPRPAVRAARSLLASQL